MAQVYRSMFSTFSSVARHHAPANSSRTLSLASSSVIT
jgi:hypothetical protein